jgi:hypothetical protein
LRRFFPRFSGGSGCAPLALQTMGARVTLRQFVLFLFSAISAMFGAVNR